MKKFLTNLWHVLRLPEMLILPGNLAFFLILSLAPIVSLFGMVASSLSLSTSSIVNYISNLFPEEVVDIILPFFDGVNVTNILFVIIGFFVASNASDSLIIASNILYKCQNKNYIYRRIKALFMTFWLLTLFIVTLIVLAFGSFILTKLLSFGILGEFISHNYIIIIIVKTIIAFFIIFLIIKILYTLAPDKKIKSKYVNYGSLFATIAIIFVTTFYSFYVNNIAHYDIIYGSLANIAILMLLIYLISYIIVLGIAINNNYYEMNNKE
mgnify:CR=1 FL=1